MEEGAGEGGEEGGVIDDHRIRWVEDGGENGEKMGCDVGYVEREGKSDGSGDWKKVGMDEKLVGSKRSGEKATRQIMCQNKEQGP